jgi:hypothetical protein
VFRGAKYEFHMWDLAGKPEVRWSTGRRAWGRGVEAKAGAHWGEGKRGVRIQFVKGGAPPSISCFRATTVYTLSPSGRTLLTVPPPPVPTCTPLPPSQLRHLWKHYYSEMSVGVVIFVVDGNDASRLPAGEIDEDVCVCVCMCVCVCDCLYWRSSTV